MSELLRIRSTPNGSVGQQRQRMRMSGLDPQHLYIGRYRRNIALSLPIETPGDDRTIGPQRNQVLLSRFQLYIRYSRRCRWWRIVRNCEERTPPSDGTIGQDTGRHQPARGDMRVAETGRRSRNLERALSARPALGKEHSIVTAHDRVVRRRSDLDDATLPALGVERNQGPESSDRVLPRGSWRAEQGERCCEDPAHYGRGLVYQDAWIRRHGRSPPDRSQGT